MNKKEKILLYPREYNKRGEQNLHSVMGVASDGRMVNVKLRIDDDFARGKRAPSIAEFSRTDRKAKNPAIASPTNSAGNREGMILFTNAVHEKSDKTKGVDHYIASWGFVICEDSESPEPITGLGRMKVKKESSTVRMMKRRLSSNLSDDERKHILASIEDPKNFDYSLMIYHPEEQFIVDAESIAEAEGHRTMEWFEGLYKRGLSFGFYIIYCDDNGDPVPNLSREHLSAFNSITVEIESPLEFLRSFTEEVRPKLIKNKSAILIPCYRVNASNGAKSYYGSPEPLKMISDVYKNSEGNARVSTVLAKTISVANGKGVIFDRIHPLKYEKLNLDLLDSNLAESRIYSSSMSLNINHKDISSTRVGIISEDDYQKLFLCTPPDDSRYETESNEPVSDQDEDASSEPVIHDTQKEPLTESLSSTLDNNSSTSPDLPGSTTHLEDAKPEVKKMEKDDPEEGLKDSDFTSDREKSASHDEIDASDINQDQKEVSPAGSAVEVATADTKLESDSQYDDPPNSDEVNVSKQDDSSDEDSLLSNAPPTKEAKKKTSGVAAFIKKKR